MQLEQVSKVPSGSRSSVRQAPYIKWFEQIGIEDVPLVGGKNASLGEMYRELAVKGVKVPNGFAITAEAYRLLFAGDRARSGDQSDAPPSEYERCGKPPTSGRAG